jgi:hypothetical protein
MSIAEQPVAAPPKIWQHRRRLQLRLAGVRRAMRAHLFWEGMAWTVGVAVLLAAASLLFDRFLRPELSTRLVLLILGLVAIGVVAWLKLLKPLTCRLEDLDLAELLDRRQSGIGQRIANVLQLPELLHAKRIDGSPAMIELAVAEDATALEQVDLKATLNVSRRRKVLTLLVGSAAIVIAFCLLAPSVAALWSQRWLAASRIRWPQKTYLSVLGLDDEGRLLVPRGEAAVLEVNSAPSLLSTPRGLQIAGRRDLFAAHGMPTASQVPDSVSIEYRAGSGSRKQGTFTHFGDGRFRYELQPISEPGTFSISGGDDWTNPIEMLPIDRPVVKDLIITAQLPGRSQAEVHRVGQQDAQLQFLPTTKLTFALESDQPLASARFINPAGTAPELEAADATHYRASMDMKETTTFEIQMVGKLGSLASKPYFVTIGLLADRGPRVTIRVTGIGRRVTPNVRIPLSMRAVDDFGLARLCAELELTKIVEARPQPASHEPFAEQLQPVDERLPLDLEKQTEIKLEEFNAVPGNTVRLRSRATDACVLGTQEGVSRWLPLQVVTPEELFYEILTRQREQRARFRKALDAAKLQLETIQKATNTEEAAGLMRAHQVGARQVWQIATQLDATLQEMIYNDLGSTQARELLENSIVAPLRALHNETLTELGGKIQKFTGVTTLVEEDRKAAAESQQAAIDQMTRILAQMSQWESFVDVINQLRQIIKSQNDVLETTEKALKERIKGLFD